ncbi:hypothetical protein C9I89_11085 [Photobacterium lipolyticum]|uniref:Uncharacterized protein n=1 Tax=Photobacterium lipolyticum TaxID=266810 RepID=A0A2T3MY76_9GAMM|nr:hypothetical protein C9I89_11085 [Photobacterium lipolyticum]
MTPNYGSESLFAGPQDHRTTGPQDHRTTGPQDHRTTGPQDHRTTGPQDHRSIVDICRVTGSPHRVTRHLPLASGLPDLSGVD